LLRRKDGSFRVVDYRAVAHIQPGVHVSVIRDITERRRMQEAISQSEERLQLAQNAAKIGTFEWNIQTGEAIRSKQLEAIHGFPDGGYVGGVDAWKKRVHPDDWAQTEREFNGALTTGNFSCEFRIVWPDQSIHWVHARAKVFFDGNGQPLKMIGINIDITDLKLNQEALQDRETHLHIALRTARLGSWEWDIERNEVDCSEECKAGFGYAAEETFSYEIALNAIHPEDRDRVESLLREAIAKGTIFEAEYRVVWRDGSIHWLRSSGQAIYSPDGKALRFVGVILDITERKRYDEERDLLLAREQSARRDAESANEAKDQFLAIVSHELRSPLNTIIGWTRMINAKKVDAEMAAKAINVIERSAIQQARMIEDLLDFSRIVAGNLRLDVDKLDLKEVIQHVVDSTAMAAAAKSITIKTELPTADLLVDGDSMRLQQIVQNLVSNAIKFTPNGGKVSIAAETDGTTATLRVTDSGCGISNDFLPYVFDRFRQAELDPTKRHSGLGLGLAIAKNLVEIHGGRVSAFSAGTDRGSTFTVELPVANAVGQVFHQEIGNAIHEDISPDALKGLRILLVDDEAAIRKMLKAFLERQGAEVRPSATATEAIQAMEQWTPDVLLSDIGMPDEDGLALISRVRVMESSPLRDVLAIALTGHTRDDDRDKALSAGYQMYVPKSVKPAELVATIATLAKSRTA